MKLTVSRSSLLSALAPAVAIANRRSPSAFGSCVHFHVSSSKVTIQARDAVSAARSRCEAEVAKAGTVAIPAEDFNSRIEAMQDGPITIDYAKDKITIKQGPRNYTLRTLDADGYPAFPSPPPGGTTIQAKALSDALSAVSYAATDDISMPQFCGVVVANDTATASDGKRIARVTSPLNLNTFIPMSAMKALSVVLERGGDVTVGTNESFVYVKAGDVELAYQRPGVDAPKYEMVMGFLRAKDGPSVARRGLIERITAMTVDGTSGGAPVVLRASDGVLHLAHTNMQTQDTATDEMELDGSGEWTVAAEARYLTDALRRLSGEFVKVCVVEDDMQQPIVFRDEAGGLATIARIDPKHAIQEAA